MLSGNDCLAYIHEALGLIYVLSVCVHVYHMCAQCQDDQSGEDIRTPGTRVMDGCEPPYQY